MAEEGTKREGAKLLGLPPRKRFKVMEQQRRKEVQEEVLDSHCTDITNILPLHRVSPKKLTSQGFLVLEKQKYKLQQQQLLENLAPVVVPPRPVPVKRKDAPTLPLPAPPTMRLKFQGEKVHCTSSSAFKSWGSPSPNKTTKPDAAPKPSGSPRGARKDQAYKPKRHHQDTPSAPAAGVQPTKTWTMAKGTTCSINKAQEDVDMTVCEAPVLSSDICSSDEDAMSTPTKALDLNVVAKGDNGIHIASDDNMVEASPVAEVEMMAATVPTEDVIHDVEDVSYVPLEETHVADDFHAPVVEATHVDVARASDNEVVVEDAQQVDGPTLDAPVEPTDVFGAEESMVVDVSEALEMREVPEANATKATLDVPEACSSLRLAAGSSIPAVEENRTVSETSNTSKLASEDLAVAVVHKEERNHSDPSDTADDETCEEKGAQAVAHAVVVREGVAGTTLRDSLEGRDEQETDTEQDGLLAEIDERAEKLFKRMFEREGYGGCDDEEDGSGSQFFFASNGVNNFNSVVVGMEVDGASTPEQKNGVGRAVDVSSLDEDHQIDLERPTVHVPNKPPEETASEMPECSSRASEGLEDSVCSEDQETDSMKSQDIVCKSSKEDSDWDIEMEVPNFGFGKRSGGMTQRVKAPGRWSQSKPATKLDDEEVEEEADEEEDEGACDVCRSADAKPSDPIVYCDGCDVPVHADCYGNPLSHGIPEGDWFCAQCQSKRADSRTCCLCPRSGGVMKMTTNGNWAHLSCAVFVPEVFFRNADDMEGIDTSHVPSKRYLAKCCVCKSHGGACVDCTEIGCKARFHVSCALKKDLAMEFRNGRSGAIVISFCHEHTAAWDEQQERKGRSKYKIVSREPQKTKVFQRSKSR